MKPSINQILLILACIFSAISCDRFQIYEKPDYLTGKLNTQLGTLDNVETFKYCIEKVGLDSIIDVSGYYTLMAPTDSAFTVYLTDKGYASVDDISYDELFILVSNHILQGGFTPDQLVGLSSTGWIDPSNTSGKPNAFKRETILQPQNKVYDVKLAPNADADDQLVLSGSSYGNAKYNVYAPVRKYVPVYFQEFFGLGDFGADDYAFYFDRPYESDFIYYNDAKILGSNMNGADNPAENGFIYSIDKVVEPLMSVEEFLVSKPEDVSYDKVLALIYRKSKVVINESATESQVGFEDGLAANLYDVTYEYSGGLKFDIASESTRENYIGKSTERSRIASTHNSMFLINDEDYTSILSSFVGKPDYVNSISELDDYVYDELLNAYMARQPIVYTKLKEGYYTENYDFIQADVSDVDLAYYGSNATLVALDEPIVPDVFTSVTASIYLKPKHSLMRRVVMAYGFHRMLKNPKQTYTFFPLKNSPVDNTSTIDSSLMADTETTTKFTHFDWDQDKAVSINSDLPTLILNHISEETIEHKANVEFLKTLSGHYIRIDHVNNSIEGASATTYGYKGSESLDILLPEKETYGNGEVYPVDTWFELPNITFTSSVLSSGGIFGDYLRYTGIVNSIGDLTINTIENYTVFVPTDQAMLALDTAGMTVDELKAILLNHFIPGQLIFTDNDFAAGNYATLSGRKVALTPSADAIAISQVGGEVITSVNESYGRNNLMSKRDLEFDENSIGDDVTAGVVHILDEVLILND